MRRTPRFLHAAMAGFLVVAVLTSACVSRNVESISSEEAAAMSPPPAPGSEPEATPEADVAPGSETEPAGDPVAGPGESAGAMGSAPNSADAARAEVDPGAGIEVSLDVEPGAAGDVPQGATLYLIVRVAGREGGAPIAVKRLPASVPVTVTVSDADAMMPGTPLIGDLDIIARIDQDGSATTREPGDFEGRVGPVQAGARVSITLARVDGTGDTESPS